MLTMYLKSAHRIGDKFHRLDRVRRLSKIAPGQHPANLLDVEPGRD